MTRRGRPRSDRLALVERVTVAFIADPTASPDSIRREVRARRRDVWRIVACLRKALEAGKLDPDHQPHPDHSGAI